MARKPPQYEDSSRDVSQDKRGQGLLGIGARQYEMTARDKRENAAGQRKMNQRKPFKGKGR